jgi:hypothetical protein
MTYKLCSVLLAASWSAYSADYAINSKKRLEIPIAQSALTRIYVEGDRIHQVFGLEGAYILETEEETGQIFIKPVDENPATPFALTILTEDGVTQDLWLKPVAGPVEAVGLRQGKKKGKVAHLGGQGPGGLQASSYAQEILEIIKRALNDQEGLYFEPLDEDRVPEIRLTGIEVKGIRSLQDDQYIIRIFEVKNDAFSPIPLELQEFQQPEDVAVGLNKKKLRPQERATLVRVSLRKNSL